MNTARPIGRRRAMTVLSILAFAGVSLAGVAGAEPPPESPGQPPPGEPPPPSQPPPANSRNMIQGEFVPTKDSGLRIRGTAKLIRGQRGSTKLSVHASGLPPTTGYPTWLHSGACADNAPAYMQDANGVSEPPNQLWASSDPADPKAPLQSSASGNAKGYGRAPWTARPEARSVVIHSPDAGNPPLACADLQ
jgi:hypothetical protein